MSTEGQRKIRRRRRLYKENPYCPDCGVFMILPEDVVKVNGKMTYPDNLATTEHDRSRFNPSRWDPNTNASPRTSLLCRKCNHLRGKKEQKTIGKDKLRILSKCHHMTPEERMLVLKSVLAD